MPKKKNNKYILKKEIRKKSYFIRKHLSPYQYDASFNATKNLIKFLKIGSLDIIGCYWPNNSEIDTRPLISFLSLKNIKIALPFIEKEEMLFKAWNVNEELYFSRYRFYSPAKSSKTLYPNVIITPALALDFKGNRIGYGAGFYDKYYNKNKSSLYIGFTYTRQIFNALPFAKHDLKLNAIVTDSFIKTINLKTK